MAPYFPLYFVKINIWNKECTQDCFSWNVAVNFKVHNQEMINGQRATIELWMHVGGF